MKAEMYPLGIRFQTTIHKKKVLSFFSGIKQWATLTAMTRKNKQNKKINTLIL